MSLDDSYDRRMSAFTHVFQNRRLTAHARNPRSNHGESSVVGRSCLCHFANDLERQRLAPLFLFEVDGVESTYQQLLTASPAYCRNGRTSVERGWDIFHTQSRLKRQRDIATFCTLLDPLLDNCDLCGVWLR